MMGANPDIHRLEYASPIGMVLSGRRRCSWANIFNQDYHHSGAGQGNPALTLSNTTLDCPLGLADYIHTEMQISAIWANLQVLFWGRVDSNSTCRMFDNRTPISDWCTGLMSYRHQEKRSSFMTKLTAEPPATCDRRHRRSVEKRRTRGISMTIGFLRNSTVPRAFSLP
jgi:hypothetical protein